MNRWNFRDKLQRFMWGRYGNDRLNQFLMVVAIVLMVLSMFGVPFVYLFSIALLVLIYWRMFSRNTVKRAEENQRYMSWEWKQRSRFSRWKNRVKDRRANHIYKCPNCKQKIRVPRGRGKIAIRCRKCGTEFIKKS